MKKQSSKLNANILIVDDDQFVLDINRKILAGLGYKNVSVATDGAGAIYKLSDMSSSFDLIILDLKMPDVNGFDLINFLSVNNFKIPVIILSGESDEMIKKARSLAKQGEIHLLDVLHKPLEKNKLKKILTDNFNL